MAKRPAFEDYVAPWETKEGDDITEGEVDKAKLKKFLWNLLGDKDKAEAEAHDAKEEVKTLKKAQEDAAHADDDELTKAQHEAEKAKADLEAEKAKTAEAKLETARLKVGAEKGLSAAQMSYLTGKDEDELSAAADKFIEDNGLTPKSGEGAEEGDETGKVPQARPPHQARTPGDPDPNADRQDDPTQWAADFARGQNPLS